MWEGGCFYVPFGNKLKYYVISISENLILYKIKKENPVSYTVYRNVIGAKPSIGLDQLDTFLYIIKTNLITLMLYIHLQVMH